LFCREGLIDGFGFEIVTSGRLRRRMAPVVKQIALTDGERVF
jgi:hypothetical protein